MGIKGFFKRHWNWLTDKISNHVDSGADKVDASLNENYPLSTRFFRKLGITPQSILNEGKAGLNYLSEKSQNLLGGLRDAGLGFLGVAATFIPFLPGRTSIWWAMGNKNLRGDFFRAVNRNTIFIGAGTVLLKWPEFVYQNFLRSRLPSIASIVGMVGVAGVIGKVGENGAAQEKPENQRKNEESLGIGFYSLFVLNLVMIYKFLKYRRLVAHFKHFLVEDILDTAVINDKASKLEINQLTADLKRISDNERVALLDPRPKAIKEVVRTKIFTTLETTVKDYFMISALLLNQLFLGSKFLALGGWLFRARIMGKDLGTSQIAATGISQLHLRRIQGHRNFQFLGEGIAYLGLDELSRALFYLLTGLYNTPGYNFPINVALSCLAYKVSILSTYMKRMDIKETDWSEEGVNLDTIYRPLLIDPLLDLSASRIEQRFKKDRENQGEEAKIKNEDMAVMAKMKEKEASFWEGMLQKKLTKAEREFLHLHAENLIFFLSAFKQSRSNGVEYCIKFLALLFPKRIQEVMRIGLEELTDERIDKMIKFLLINKKSSLLNNGKDRENDKWISVENEILSPKKAEFAYEDGGEEIETFDITPKEIAAIHYAVAKTLACHNSGIIDIRKIDELDNADHVLQAEVDCQYDPIPDENETRDAISPLQSPLDVLSEKFSLPVRQFMLNYKIARDSGMSRTRVIVDSVSDGVSAVSEQIDKHLIGGTTTLRVAGLASSVLGGPVAIGITAVVAQTVAEHAPSIKAGAAVVGNIVDGLNISNMSGNAQNDGQNLSAGPGAAPSPIPVSIADSGFGLGFAPTPAPVPTPTLTPVPTTPIATPTPVPDPALEPAPAPAISVSTEPDSIAALASPSAPTTAAFSPSVDTAAAASPSVNDEKKTPTSENVNENQNELLSPSALYLEQFQNYVSTTASHYWNRLWGESTHISADTKIKKA